MILTHPRSNILDNEHAIINEKRPMLKRAKISCLWQQNSNVHGKAANQPRIANDPLKCLHWRTLQSLSRYLPTFDLQGHIFKVKGQIGANYKILAYHMLYQVKTTTK